MDEEKVLHGNFSKQHSGPDSEPPEEGKAIPPGEAAAEAILRPFRRKGKGDGSRADILSVVNNLLQDINKYPDDIDGVMIFSFWREGAVKGVGWAGKFEASEVVLELEKAKMEFVFSEFSTKPLEEMPDPDETPA